MPYIFALIVVLTVCYLYKKNIKLSFLLFFFLILILHIFSITEGHSWGDDFMVYLAQSRALLDGDINSVITKQQLIQELSKTKSGPILYPWGYPVFLAILNRLFGDSYFVYKMLNVVAISLTGLITTLIIKTSKKKSALLFLLIGLNPFLFDYKNEINADILLMFFTTLSILLMKNILSAKNRHTILQAVFAGFTFFLCVFIKAAGLVIIIIFLVYAILSFMRDRQRRISLLSIGCLLAVYLGALFITDKLLPNYFSDYISYYSIQSIFKTAGSNFISYVFLIKNFVYNSNNVLYFVSVLAGSMLFLTGIVLDFKKYFYLNFFLLFFFSLIVVTPYPGGVRYLLPLLPVFFLYIFLGAEYLYDHNVKYLSFTGVILILLLIFCFCVNDFKYLSRQNKLDKISNEAFSVKAKQFYNFLQTNTTDADTIIFFKPRFLSFYLNRIAASYYEAAPIKTSKFKYLTIYRDLNSNKKELEVILPDYQKRKVFDNGDFQVYDLK